MISRKFILALFCSVGVALPFAAVAQLPTTPASGSGTSAPTGGGMSAPAGGSMSDPAPGSMTKPPHKMSPKPKSGKSSTTTVSVNSAPAAEMLKVKGIGPATAKKIIANRPYASLDDLVTKKVLTKSQFTQLKAQLSL
jgi:DNA uptake protein ComE-like DNA-binding protein